jgi:hypothetical protein
LHLALQAGLFREKSLLIKSLRHTLTGQQFARYEAMARKAGLVSDEDGGADSPDERVAPVKE